MKNHPLVRALLELRGNPRACVFTEPLWGVPYNLYMPFAAVYMSALLLTDRQIGLVASVVMFFRAISAVLSGAITDKFGRHKTTFFLDSLAWALPCLLWAISQNFWWFMVAAAFNGLWQITDTSWNCLLVEDAQKSQLVNIYSWVHISGQLAVFFAPLSGLLVNKLTLVPAMRILYLFSFVSMSAKFWLLYRYSSETEMGKARLKETAGVSLFKLISGYGDIGKKVFASPEMRLSLAINALFTITGMVMVNFFGLYTTQNLGVPPFVLAYFPIIKSVIILAFFFFIQSKIARFGFKAPMLIGVGFYIISHVVLITAQGGGLAVPIIYAICEAFAHALVMPRKDSIVALFLDGKERARIMSVMTVIILAISIPFGFLAGLASDFDRKLPFVINIVIFAGAFLVILKNRQLSRKSMEAAAE